MLEFDDIQHILLTRVPALLSISSTIAPGNPACAGSSFTANAINTAQAAVTMGGMMNNTRHVPGSTASPPRSADTSRAREARESPAPRTRSVQRARTSTVTASARSTRSAAPAPSTPPSGVPTRCSMLTVVAGTASEGATGGSSAAHEANAADPTKATMLRLACFIRMESRTGS